MKLHQWIFFILFMIHMYVSIRAFIVYLKKMKSLDDQIRNKVIDHKELKNQTELNRFKFFNTFLISMGIFVILFFVGIFINLNIYRFTD